VFADYVDEMFRKNRNSFDDEAPYIGDIFDPMDPLERSVQARRVYEALCYRQAVQLQSPAWTPQLPLRAKDCEAMASDPDPRMRIFGLFALSSLACGWDEQHPDFYHYAGALMACPHAPARLQNDPSLLAEFKPQLLDEGRIDETLRWRPYHPGDPADTAPGGAIEAASAARLAAIRGTR
jgi:hypothetical protein